jgi:metal transporter CNNM
MRKGLTSFLLLTLFVSYFAVSNGWATRSQQLSDSLKPSMRANSDRLLQDETETTEHTTTTEEVHSEHEEKKYSPSETGFWVCLFMIMFLTCFSGLMSGLTVGCLSIDELQLELKLKNGTEQEKEDARILMPILHKHHLLLSTLLLANALALESLPLFLDAIVPAILAVLISTTLILVFGEVVPQAYCTGPSQIQIARAMTPIIKTLMWLFYPLCYPISIALDRILGVHGKTRFVKKDLKALIELHKIDRSGAARGHHDGVHEIKADAELTNEEIRVINSTIDLRDTPVTKEMERIEKVFMISNIATIDQDMIKRIIKSGFSKIPVYKNHDKNNIIGILKVKSLLAHDKVRGSTVEEAQIRLMTPVIVSADTSMLEMLMLFQEKKTSIALVSEEKVKDKGGNAIFYSRRNMTVEESGAHLVGIISLKDIFEEILESKMVDDDVHGAVTLQSGGLKKKKANRAQLDEVSEAMERPEKGLKKPLLEL